MWFKKECSQLAPLLWDFAANKLNAGEMQTVERHLQACPRCASELASCKRSMQSIDEFASIPLPKSRRGWDEVRGRIVAESLEPAYVAPTRMRFGQFSQMGAVFAAGAVAAFVLFGPRPEPNLVPINGISSMMPPPSAPIARQESGQSTGNGDHSPSAAATPSTAPIIRNASQQSTSESSPSESAPFRLMLVPKHASPFISNAVIKSVDGDGTRNGDPEPQGSLLGGVIRKRNFVMGQVGPANTLPSNGKSGLPGENTAW